jgi:hypothetical protein
MFLGYSPLHKSVNTQKKNFRCISAERQIRDVWQLTKHSTTGVFRSWLNDSLTNTHKPTTVRLRKFASTILGGKRYAFLVGMFPSATVLLGLNHNLNSLGIVVLQCNAANAKPRSCHLEWIQGFDKSPQRWMCMVVCIGETIIAYGLYHYASGPLLQYQTTSIFSKHTQYYI